MIGRGARAVRPHAVRRYRGKPAACGGGRHLVVRARHLATGHEPPGPMAIRTTLIGGYRDESSGRLVARHIHDQTRGQVEPRLDAADEDVFRVVRVGAEALQPEALDHGVLGLERGVGGVRPPRPPRRRRRRAPCRAPGRPPARAGRGRARPASPRAGGGGARSASPPSRPAGAGYASAKSRLALMARAGRVVGHGGGGGAGLAGGRGVLRGS